MKQGYVYLPDDRASFRRRDFTHLYCITIKFNYIILCLRNLVLNNNNITKYMTIISNSNATPPFSMASVNYCEIY